MNKLWENPAFRIKVDSVAEIKLKELFDGLVMENLFALQERAVLNSLLDDAMPDDAFPLNDGECYCSYELRNDSKIIARVTTQIDIQDCRLSRGPIIIFHRKNGITNIDDPISLMKSLVQQAPEDVMPDLSGLDDFMHNLALSQAQSTWSAEYTDLIVQNCMQPKVELHHWEQLCALRDRPFHPLAKAKKGWAAEQFRQYSAETSDGFGLSWVAVNNKYLVGNKAIRGRVIAECLLTKSEQEVLWSECGVRSLDCNEYTLIPVHPWHLKSHMLQEFQKPIADDHIIVMAESLGLFYPTASGRSLIPAHQELLHVKLPLALQCLGALRILPPRYLFNGYQAQKMLLDVIARMSGFNDININLCDEHQWVAYLPEGESMLSNQSGYLSCLLRSYPNKENNLIPMAAFAVAVGDKVPALEWLYRQQEDERSFLDFSMGIFSAITKLLCQFSFHCFSFGLMPEVHGQNILVGFNRASLRQLTLRDHDTLRIFPPWIQQQQIPLQDYKMDWSTPNSLICLAPQQLLSYFLTLGVQVNLLSIADALSRSYGIPMEIFWEKMKSIIEELLNEMDIPVITKAILRKEIMDNKLWPSRKILSPCLIKRNRMMGMPNSVGSVINPFHRLSSLGAK
ncbi:MAG TPA: IucA/IucC family protein [Cellvibrio sp.]|nr:IucA/IucC family protein [Cellvibrio sp.]